MARDTVKTVEPQAAFLTSPRARARVAKILLRKTPPESVFLFCPVPPLVAVSDPHNKTGLFASE